MNGWRWMIGLLVLLVGQATTVQADLIITVGSGVVDPGKTTTVDVFIRSTTGTDKLDSFSLEYLLTLVTPGGTAVASFTNPQSDSQLTDGAYLLDGNSLAANNLYPPTLVSTTNYLNDTYFGGDGAIVPPVLVPTTDTLLTRLDITAGAGSPGNVYSLGLLSGPFTVFFDNTFAPIPFATTAGTLTVIPEPGTVFLLAGGVTAVWYLRRRRPGMA